MRFIETVFREFFQQSENRLGRVAIDVIRLLRAFDKNILLRVHHGFNFLTHRAAEDVGAAKCVARDNLGGLHDLFLVNQDTISFFDQLFE